MRRPAKRPTPTTAPAAPSSVELAAAPLSEDQFDVKPQVGVDGWLASPKRTTQPAIEARTEPPSKAGTWAPLETLASPASDGDPLICSLRDCEIGFLVDAPKS